MTAAAVIVIAACIAAACVQRRTRQPRRPDAVDYAEQEERMMRAAANIVQLCGVVHAQQTAVRVPPPVQIWLN